MVAPLLFSRPLKTLKEILAYCPGLNACIMNGSTGPAGEYVFKQRTIRHRRNARGIRADESPGQHCHTHLERAPIT